MVLVGRLLCAKHSTQARCKAGERFGEMVRFLSLVGAAAAMAVPCAAVAGSNPWADSVVSYVQGTNADSDHNVAANALGSPERVTGEDSPFGSFPGSVTPFAAAFGFDEFVSIGAGGSLTVSFAQPVTNDPLNPFGVDLLVFGNSFFTTSDFVTPRTTGISSDGGIVEVSADGVSWFVAPGAADGLFPTLGFSDETNPFGGAAGNVLSDFTKPVDPSFAWQNKTLSELITGYNGSGGGLGIDIGALGLSQISFVRVSVPSGSFANIEIDAFSDVTAIPAPGVAGLLLASMTVLRRRR
jgi:hypothetical protein